MQKLNLLYRTGRYSVWSNVAGAVVIFGPHPGTPGGHRPRRDLSLPESAKLLERIAAVRCDNPWQDERAVNAVLDELGG